MKDDGILMELWFQVEKPTMGLSRMMVNLSRRTAVLAWDHASRRAESSLSPRGGPVADVAGCSPDAELWPSSESTRRLPARRPSLRLFGGSA